MKNKYGSLDKDLKKVLFDSFRYYNEIRDKKVFANKQKDFSLDSEFTLLDQIDKKVISVYLGILNNENEVSEILNKNEITREKVIKYLNVEDLSLKTVQIDDFVIDKDFLEFIDKIGTNSKMDLSNVAYSLYRNFFCGSDIISNFYYSEISIERSRFNQDKKTLENTAKGFTSNNFNFVPSFNYDFTLKAE